MEKPTNNTDDTLVIKSATQEIKTSGEKKPPTPDDKRTAVRDANDKYADVDKYNDATNSDK